MSTPARLRPLAPTPVDVGGEWFVGLTDLLGVAPGDGRFAALLRPTDWHLAQTFDSTTEAAALAARARTELGLEIDAAAVEALEERLSLALLLEDARGRDALEREWRAYRELAERPPQGIGRDYPADPFELRQAIGGMVADDWDLPPPTSCVGAWTCEAGLRVARALHARTWAALRHFAAEFQRVLVLAPLRAPFAAPWVVLAKPLATPLGSVALDAGLAGMFGVPEDPTALAARSSLVLERQALFLRVLLRGLAAAFVLVRPARDERECQELESRLERALALPGTLLVVAADLALEHRALPGPSVVPKSDRSPTLLRRAPGAPSGELLITHPDLERSRADDREAVDAVTRVDRPRLDDLRRSERSAYRAASLGLLAPVLGALTRIHPGARGSLLGYAQANDRGSLVTGASVLIH